MILDLPSAHGLNMRKNAAASRSPVAAHALSAMSTNSIESITRHPYVVLAKGRWSVVDRALHVGRPPCLARHGLGCVEFLLMSVRQAPALA